MKSTLANVKITEGFRQIFVVFLELACRALSGAVTLTFFPIFDQQIPLFLQFLLYNAKMLLFIKNQSKNHHFAWSIRVHFCG